jgi:hypothetical protein
MECAAGNNINALLSFCSKHQLLLRSPEVHGLSFARAANASQPEFPTVLLFGGSINASIIGGSFSNNTAGVTLGVRQQARLHIKDTSVYGHKGKRSYVVLASDKSMLSISNSSFRDTAVAVVSAVRQASIAIQSSSFRSNIPVAIDGVRSGVIQLSNEAIAVIASSSFDGNRAFKGTAVSAFDRSQVRRIIPLAWYSQQLAVEQLMCVPRDAPLRCVSAACSTSRCIAETLCRRSSTVDRESFLVLIC